MKMSKARIHFQIKVLQKGPMDATERGPANERQMTSAADSLYGAVFRAQTVTLHRPPPAAIPATVSAAHSLTILYAVLFVI